MFPGRRTSYVLARKQQVKETLEKEFYTLCNDRSGFRVSGGFVMSSLVVGKIDMMTQPMEPCISQASHLLPGGGDALLLVHSTFEKHFTKYFLS